MKDKLRKELEAARQDFLDAHDLSLTKVVTDALEGDKMALYDWCHYVKFAHQRLMQEWK